MNKLKLYIGNLPYQVETANLKESFEKFGEIVDVVVIKDRESGRSRGFGFVTYANESSAGAALQAMNGEVILGRPLRIKYAEPRKTEAFA